VKPPQTEAAPLPGVDERSEPYWAALARSELMLRQCAVCTALDHPAAESCRVCSSPRLDWTRVEPTGRLFSWAIEHRAVIPGFEPPYVIAQVTPDACAPGEVRLVGTLLVDDPDRLEIDMPVRLVTAPVPGTNTVLGHFTPS
jgi:uncharacterized OB-fold protein